MLEIRHLSQIKNNKKAKKKNGKESSINLKWFIQMSVDIINIKNWKSNKERVRVGWSSSQNPEENSKLKRRS